MKLRVILATALLSNLLWTAPACADDDDDDSSNTVTEQSETGAPTLGLVQDTLRRSRKQPTIFQTISDGYSDFQTRMESEHGLTWSFSLSYRQRWVSPDNIGTSSQTLFWPTLNWDIFDSETFGAGSFQFLYFGEHSTGSSVTLSRGSRILSGQLPDYQSKYSQITYTHTLPGERLALAVGQYSFFNFDSSEFMADQQLNFVNNIFSANGSATYPTTGTGGYAQFNATKNLQFLVGGQSVNIEDTSKRPTDGFLSSPYAWLGYVQWTPGFKGLGDAQYSLTLYQAPAVTDHPASQGWSINAVQHLNEHWALFGRLNASRDDVGGGNKRSYGLGAALNNPLGRAAGDQIGVAFGSLKQRLPLPFVILQHTQNTLEAYWNWSLLGGLLVTPDAQYIRNPAFAFNRDSAWILSLRTTLAF